jgi:hypothetical protein
VLFRQPVKIRPGVLLGVILVAAVALRAIFFVGLASGDPQDDGNYYKNAFALYEERRTHLEQFRSVPADWLANPIDQFHVRPMVTYPIAGIFMALGPGETSAALWSFLCSMVTILVIYRLGEQCRPGVGLMAALLCAFYPLEVINATRILSDVQVGMFSALSLLFFVAATRRPAVGLFLAAGAATGGAYLANARGLIFLLILCGSAIALALQRRIPWRGVPLLLAGFAGVFCIEASFYYAKTGDPLLSYHIQAGAASFKYLHEPVAEVRSGPLRIAYTNGEPFEMLKSVLRLTGRPTDQFGFFFVLFLAAACFSLVKRRNGLLLAIAAALALYLEFGPVRLAMDWAQRELHYMMVFKQERFVLMLTAPLIVPAADFLEHLATRHRVAVAIVLVALLLTSLAAISQTQRYYRSGLQELRSVANDVETLPDRTFYGDFWAVDHLMIFTQHRARNLRVLHPNTSLVEIGTSCVVLGGSRGVELLAEYVEGSLPRFARDILAGGQPPAGWRLVKELRGPLNPQRQHVMQLYCVDVPPG